MSIEINPKKSSGVERLLEISVPADTVREAEEKAAQRYASKVRLPGFRQGKAPAGVVRKRFGPEIRQSAIESLVQEAYKEAVEREKLTPASQPHVHDLKFEEGQPLTFELHIEVRPDVTLPRISGFRVTRTLRPVTESQLQDQLQAMREQRATWAPTTDKAIPGDRVSVTLSMADDGNELTAGREYRLELGGGQAIPGIEELIMEVAPGETIERPVRWPDDFPDEAQRGVTKKVRVSLSDVKRRVLPELDDAFAREMGDFDSLAALTATVREDLTAHAAREADADVRQKLVDEVAAANPFDIPPSWVAQLVDAYANAYQVPDDGRPTFDKEFRPMAERQVRRDLIIDAVAKRENLSATEAEVDDKVSEMASKRKENPSEVYASLQKAGRLREIERGILEEKVFKWLLANNTVEEN